MATEEIKSPPKPRRNPSKGSVSVENSGNRDTMFSPRFRSAAAMAGWDEEALLLATLIVEDTPERESKQKKKNNLHFKTPPVSSRRKRRVHRQSSTSIPIVVLNLEFDDEETVVKEKDGKKMEPTSVANKEKENEKEDRNALPDQKSSNDSSLPVPCIDQLKEELSCAICLEICFEPSTTPCGHSFCKQCLKSAADKCGKRCPKCRQLISNGRYCTVNTVLWNTIQLLFPQEVEAKKASSRATTSSPECKRCPSPREMIDNLRNRSTLSPGVPLSRQLSARRRRAAVPSQSEDAALALRLQREEFMEAFRVSNDEQPRARAAAAAAPISSARANIRAMASRAMNLRIRERFR